MRIIRSIRKCTFLSACILLGIIMVAQATATADASGEMILVRADDDTATVSVPAAGVLTTDDETISGEAIRLEPVGQPEVLATAGSTAGTFTGYGYRILPKDLTFHPPATLKIIISAGDWKAEGGDNLSVRKYNTTSGWVKIPVRVDASNRSVEAAVTQSGMYALFENTTIDAAGDSPSALTKSPQKSWTALIGLCGAVLLAIIFRLRRP
ncbi:hypothetical protein FGU65_00050 [Methanoculleus sp. FWC-SCC1]|uniref:PGF-pre-PGF domain-containing protein n=2 Tax=Methanoculleus frigidifontis TaxID=2584085 RepID=A0ABT8M5T7_9EURY|nr:hypothetical protein [Methanoculleus sp. FWC-SCC1]